MQSTIKENISARFVQDYLYGYFETVHAQETGLHFVDYSRKLADLYKHHEMVLINDKHQLSGQIGYQGKVSGKVKIITNPHTQTLEKGDILVCDFTTPDFVMHMQNAAAIVTNRGGILSHAAIIARELQKPCIVATENATHILKDGDIVEVDATKGIVEVQNGQ